MTSATANVVHLLLATELVWELACRRGARARATVVSDRHRSSTRRENVTCAACIRAIERGQVVVPNEALR